LRLDAIEAAVRKAILRGLPGLEAQLRMAPAPRAGWDPYNPPEGLRDAAVALLVYSVNDAPSVLLTVRGAGLRSHTGQVSLPGGAVDLEESIETAALREASEEVGIPPASVRLLGRLTPVHIPVSGYLLHPVIGVLDDRPTLRAAEWEVARILEVPISLLLDTSHVKRQTRVREILGQTVNIEVPYFEIDGEEVWGATAMVLEEFLAIVRGVFGKP
jgi:8-oxo-dGTP pyrophosphatase MutT (NUDIX family)